METYKLTQDYNFAKVKKGNRVTVIELYMTALLLFAAAYFTGCSDDEHSKPVVPEVTVTGDYILQIGDKLETLTLTGSAVSDGQSVEGTFTWKNGQTVYNQIGKYDAGWIFTPADTDRYTSKEGIVKVDVQQSTSQIVIARFKEYFYQGGRVHANRLNSFQDSEWALATDDARKPLDIFMEITGMPAPMKSQYEYCYQSSDGKCNISIKGSAEADTEAVFATINVYIPEYKDIETMHIVTIDYFKGDNSDDIITGVPVIYAK